MTVVVHVGRVLVFGLVAALLYERLSRLSIIGIGIGFGFGIGFGQVCVCVSSWDRTWNSRNSSLSSYSTNATGSIFFTINTTLLLTPHNFQPKQDFRR